MGSISPQQLIDLIPPVILVSALVYLIRFFGRVISDQKYYADDRDWDSEAAGIFFFLVIIFGVVLGLGAAFKFGDLGIGHLVKYIVIVLLDIWLFFTFLFTTEKFYKIRKKGIREYIQAITLGEIKIKEISDTFLKINQKITFWVFPIIFTYSAAIEIKSESLLWTILNISQILFGFVLLAINYSMSKTRLPQIDIFFTNSRKPVRNVTLLKFNKDNIRTKQGEKVVIFNRNIVERIEILPFTREKK